MPPTSANKSPRHISATEAAGLVKPGDREHARRQAEQFGRLGQALAHLADAAAAEPRRLGGEEDVRDERNGQDGDLPLDLAHELTGERRDELGAAREALDAQSHLNAQAGVAAIEGSKSRPKPTGVANSTPSRERLRRGSGFMCPMN